MSHEPIQPPPVRRRGARPASTPGARPRMQRAWQETRDRMAKAGLRPPKLKTPSRKSMAWAGGVLAVLAIAVAVPIAIWDWNWFRGPIARIASARTHREVTIAGDLNTNIWSWQPWATATGVTIGNPKWAGDKPMGTFPKITVQVRLIPLLWGQVDLRRLAFDAPVMQLYADADGRRNWDFSDGRDPAPMRLPPIRSFELSDGRLDYNDVRRKLTFNATLNAHERLGVQSRGFAMTGQGTINAEPFRMEVTGGPLVNIDRARPYPFDADIHAGDTYITVRGAVRKPFDLGQFYMAATARGPDMAELFPLTGVALPNTPPYALQGRLTRDDLVWKVDGLSGRVGDSDLAGDVKVTTGGKRPFLEAKLSSRSLDFDDIGALFGGAPATGPGETASPQQRAVAQALNAQQQLFPDATLDLTRMRAIDADVAYTAASVRDAPIKLGGASVRVKLDDGLLKANPMRLELARGLVQGHVTLDARKATPTTDLDLRLTNARIENLIPFRFEGASPLTGTVLGRAKLTGSGNSVHKAFASADGEVMLVAPDGQILKAFAELASVNVVKGLGLLNKKDTTELRCAVAHFNTKAGVMTADTLVVDTGPVLITGKGTVNLKTERMNFTLRGRNKKFRLVRVLLPVTVRGPIRAAKLGVKPGAAIAQGAGALSLAAVLSPLGAILPFIDPGLAKDANCAALIAQARADGAPVASVQPKSR